VQFRLALLAKEPLAFTPPEGTRQADLHPLCSTRSAMRGVLELVAEKIRLGLAQAAEGHGDGRRVPFQSSRTFAEVVEVRASLPATKFA